MELEMIRKEREDLLAQLGELNSGSLPSKELQFLNSKLDVDDGIAKLSSLEVKMHKDEAMNNKEKAKLRMRLRYTQLRLDTYRYRHKKALDELDLMNTKYKAASANLKNQLASYVLEVLNLKKQLAAVKDQ